MPLSCLIRWFIPISTNVTVLICLIFSIVLSAILFTIGLFSVSKKILISMLALIASIVLTTGLTIFSAITYSYAPKGANEQMQKYIFNINKKFLLGVNTLFVVVLGAISFCVYSFRNDFFNFIGLVFDDYYNGNSNNSLPSISKSEKLVKYMENRFKCHYFDSNSPSGNCAEVIEKFLNANSKLFAIILGVVSIIFLILLIVGIYFDSKSKSDGNSVTNNDRSENANYDLNQELNPNVAADF